MSAPVLRHGQRIVLAGKHPWATHAGHVVRWDEGVLMWLVHLDTGQDVFSPRTQMRILKEDDA